MVGRADVRRSRKKRSSLRPRHLILGQGPVGHLCARPFFTTLGVAMSHDFSSPDRFAFSLGREGPSRPSRQVLSSNPTGEVILAQFPTALNLMPECPEALTDRTQTHCALNSRRSPRRRQGSARLRLAARRGRPRTGSAHSPLPQEKHPKDRARHPASPSSKRGAAHNHGRNRGEFVTESRLGRCTCGLTDQDDAGQRRACRSQHIDRETHSAGVDPHLEAATTLPPTA